jgi:hypothetical protein
MPTLSAAVEICLTIMTDAAAAMHILVVISIMMFGPNARNYVLAPADPAEKPCYGVFSTPAGIVGASLVFKFLLSCFARFHLLADYKIDLVNVLRYLLHHWGFFLAVQLTSASSIMFVLLLRHAGVSDILYELFKDAASETCAGGAGLNGNATGRTL